MADIPVLTPRAKSIGIKGRSVSVSAGAYRRAYWVDAIARMLTAICLFNLNGVMWLAFDEEALASIAMLGPAVLLVVFAGRHAWSLPFSLFVGAITTYLAFGALFMGTSSEADDLAQYVRAYGGTLVILWAFMGYTASLVDNDKRLLSFLRFVRNTLLLGAASVWFSPILYQYYVNVPLAFSIEERMGGFFANPNEAAMVAVFAVVFVKEVPFSNRLLGWLALAVALIAVFLTFSKTGMTCAIVYLAWSVVRKLNRFGVALLLPIVIVAILLVQDPEGVLRYIAENPMLQLETAQQNRVFAIGDIFSGQINAETTTGRTDLWQLAASGAWEAFPWGNGLGSGHQIVGGLFQNDGWLGAHNTFLMIWYESGILPAILLIVAMVWALSNTLRNPSRHLILPILIVLLVDMMVTHTALSTRYHNLIMALILGLLASERVRRWRSGEQRIGTA
jgi:O-antigen ligase